jgi:hypothetical protein
VPWYPTGTGPTLGRLPGWAVSEAAGRRRGAHVSTERPHEEACACRARVAHVCAHVSLSLFKIEEVLTCLRRRL